MVALYGRVSTSMQENGLDAQIRSLTEYCQSRGMNQFEIFTDSNISGAKSSRPALDQMMAQIRAGRFKTIIVYSISRLARSSKHLITALDELKNLNVKFISLTENIDSETPTGKAVIVIISALAELERDIIRERVKNGLKAAKARGKRLGRPKTCPSEKIIELANHGFTQREIAHLLNCSQPSVHRALKNQDLLINTETSVFESSQGKNTA